MTPRDAAHYRVLRLIEEQPEISQRELARALGVSLGKTHYLLKALLDKGLVKANNFRRSDNKLAYAYLLTPSGIAAKLELTRAFLRLKEDEYRMAHEEIERLRRELAEMGPGPAEPLVDPIRADGRLARVHLRPWREAGLDPAALLEAFLKTAAVWREAPGEMGQTLQQAVAGAVDLGLASEAVARLAGRMREQGYPATHHSATYTRLYRPAYRVVAVGLLPPELSALLLG